LKWNSARRPKEASFNIQTKCIKAELVYYVNSWGKIPVYSMDKFSMKRLLKENKLIIFIVIFCVLDHVLDY